MSFLIVVFAKTLFPRFCCAFGNILNLIVKKLLAYHIFILRYQHVSQISHTEEKVDEDKDARYRVC